VTTASLSRRLVAEFTGTALSLAAVVGSGIMAERLSAGNTAIALLANALATGGALVALILAFGPISGAHFNPAVTIADASQGGLRWRDVGPYAGAQILRRAERGGGRAWNVRAVPVLILRSRSHGLRPGLQPGGGYFRIALHHLGRRSQPRPGRALRRGRLYRRCLLVHLVHQLCQPGGDDRAGPYRHLLRNSSRRRSPIPAGRGLGGGAATLLFRWLAPDS